MEIQYPEHRSGNFVGKMSPPDRNSNVTDEATTSSDKVNEDEVVDKRGRTTSVISKKQYDNVTNIRDGQSIKCTESLESVN